MGNVPQDHSPMVARNPDFLLTGLIFLATMLIVVQLAMLAIASQRCPPEAIEMVSDEV